MGYGSATNNNIMQEEIFNFPIQTVRDIDGFDKLLTIEGEVLEPSDVSTRDAGLGCSLKSIMSRSAPSYRLHDLMSKFIKPQQPTESGSAYVTRVINKRSEIMQAGT